MKFNEKLIQLRKAKGLSQEELGGQLGVSRQTVCKWELAQSYPDFQRLVLLSDFFELPLDALVKDVDVQEVRAQNLEGERLRALQEEIGQAKWAVRTVVNAFAVIGAVGLAVLLLIILLWG